MKMRQRVLEVAKEAGFWKDLFAYPEFKEHIETFAKLIALDENEHSALIADHESYPVKFVGDAIRARRALWEDPTQQTKEPSNDQEEINHRRASTEREERQG
jgi:hypothetical protein